MLGEQKCAYMHRVLPMLNIRELEGVGVKSFKDLPSAPAHLTCVHREHSRTHCAVLKCYQMYCHYMSFTAG